MSDSGRTKLPIRRPPLGGVCNRALDGSKPGWGGPIFTHPADGGIPAGSDLLFLVRAHGALAPVTHAGTPAPKEGAS